jgi:pimeloyl-ACP methyl ester carboxylesterase
MGKPNRARTLASTKRLRAGRQTALARAALGRYKSEMAFELLPLINRVARARLVRRGGRSRSVVAHGHEVHLLDIPGKGSGPPLILVHGLGSTALTFAQVIPGLARFSRRVLAADLPGAGFSPAPPAPPNIEEAVQILAELYQRELGGEKALLVGNSLGGAMSAELAFHRPDLVGALVLLAPAGAQVAPERFRALVQSFEMTRWREGRDFLHRLYHRPPLLLPELLAFDILASFAQPHVKRLLHGDRPNDHLAPELLRALAMPLLLLWGRSEKVLPYEGIEYFRKHLPAHAAVEEVEGWGHAPHLDRPRELVERLERFARTL